MPWAAALQEDKAQGNTRSLTKRSNQGGENGLDGANGVRPTGESDSEHTMRHYTINHVTRWKTPWQWFSCQPFTNNYRRHSIRHQLNAAAEKHNIVVLKWHSTPGNQPLWITSGGEIKLETLLQLSISYVMFPRNVYSIQTLSPVLLGTLIRTCGRGGEADANPRLSLLVYPAGLCPVSSPWKTVSAAGLSSLNWLPDPPPL